MPEPTKTIGNGRRPGPEDAVGTLQDLQRTALRDLVALSSECAARETAIEEGRRQALQACETESTAARLEIERRREEFQRDLERKHEDWLARITSQHAADLKTLATSEKTSLQQIELEHSTTLKEVKQKYTQAAWLAETVLEATQNQLKAEAKEAESDLATRRRRIAVLEQQGAAWAHMYSQEWPESAVATGPGGEDEENRGRGPKSDHAEGGGAPEAGRTATSFEDLNKAAVEKMEELGSLRLPRFMVGVVPFLIGLILCVAAAGLAQLISGEKSAQWHYMGMAAGAALVISVLATIVLRSKAFAEVRTVLAEAREVVDAAALSVECEYRRGVADREKRKSDATQKRDREVHEAKARFAPLINHATHNYEAALKVVEDERGRLQPRIEERRQQSQAEVEEWWRNSQEELRQGYENEVEAARKSREARITGVEAGYTADRGELTRSWEEGLARIQAPMDEQSTAGGRKFPPWSDTTWNDWLPPRHFASVIRFGELGVDLKQITEDLPRQLALPESFSVPAMLAFPNQASLLIHSGQKGHDQAVQTLQNVMLRLLTSLPPGRVRFTIIDPVGLGQNFAGFMHLADHDEALVASRIWTNADHIEARLADLTEHMETVIQKYLRNEFETIDDYNRQAGELAEPYRFLVVADFPTNFSDVAVQRLNSIAATGARCGVYTLVARDTRQSLPAGTHLDELKFHSVNLVFEDGRFVWDDKVFRRFPLRLDAPPSEDFLTRVLHVVGRYAKEFKRVEVPFEAITPAPDELWSRHSVGDLSVPIGRMGATRLQSLRLGRGVAQHTLIAGKTGSGKSTLLHVLITNLALWYSPDEVEFYLVDFKKGVEFKAYATSELPHARAIAVESDREFGLSVLQRVDAELTRRGTLYRNLGVQDIAAYREASKQPMPRVLLIIDEFQEFFSEDDKLAQDASLLLDRLVRQGRAFGIHVLLGSQTIGGTSGLARSTIGQMAVRIALQTTETDSQIILGDGNTAARLLSRPGEAVYNDAGGLVEGNSPFQVAWLPDERRDEQLARVREQATKLGVRTEPAVVFEGNVPADIAKNDALAKVLWPRFPADETSGETPGPHLPQVSGPPRVWLGDPVAIKEATAVTLRRQSGANLIIVGQQEEAAMATMVAGVLSLVVIHPKDRAVFWLLDGSPADSPLASVLPRMPERLPHAVRLVDYRAVPDAIGELAAECQRRQGSDDPNPPAVYVFVYGLQRYRALRRQEDSFSFSMSGEEKKPQPDRQFADLLREGPALGMHVLTWCDTLAAVERTLDRNSMREFDHRVLFQMSAADSSNLIDSPLANKLGPNRALYYSEEQGVLEKFRPYALPNAEWLAKVSERLKTVG
ncbi:MAG: AAA family ATPase [Phycisphaerae bacterium]|nr:AAA family ATPase [Phycisphaerae bacterium]